MNAVVVLEWKFSPPDYFESPIEILRDNYTMIIADGKAEARIDSAVYEANPSMHDILHGELNYRFLGVQLCSHKAYNLSSSTMNRIHPDGSRDCFVTGKCIAKVTFHPVDFQVSNKEGAIVFDSKRDRIEEKRRLADLVSRYAVHDEFLATLLQIYSAAVNDSNNELVHLYEIRDALKSKFENEKAAKQALNISRSDWSRFGDLCNKKPLRQGRHGEIILEHYKMLQMPNYLMYAESLKP